MADLIDPKDVDIETQSGEKKTFVFSKIPYWACREIVAQYPLSAMPKIGDYSLNESMAKKLFSYVGIRLPTGDVVRLNTEAMVHNHVPDLLTGGRVELGMIEYQVGFSVIERLSTFLSDSVRNLTASISKTSTQSPDA